MNEFRVLYLKSKVMVFTDRHDGTFVLFCPSISFLTFADGLI